MPARILTAAAPASPAEPNDETDDDSPLEVRRRLPYWNSPLRNRVAAAAAVLVAIATAGTFAVRSYARVPPTGVLVVNTDPGGADVFIDGKKRGRRPLTSCRRARTT
jgi:hypothetical protein